MTIPVVQKQSKEWQSLIVDVCASISKLTGNIMSEKQWPMVETRLRRRFLELKITTPEEYKEYWKKNNVQENNQLIGLLTTHFTSFFREFPHFEWISKDLPNMVASARKEGRNTLKFWSAAASKGQEVWSLCMWLDFHLSKIDPKMNWMVYGSDIDPVSIKEAENGVYHRRELETAPRHLWEKHWIRGTGDISDWYKIKANLKAHTKFQTNNLLNISMPNNEKFDLIMCRNVLIYFDRANQEKISLSLLKYLTPNGTLITGMSESLSGMGLPIRGLSASVYKPQTAPVIELVEIPKSKERPLALPVPMKILCVDDSPTVISILKKILSTPEFEVVGIAQNGEEAIQKMEQLKPDAITLDLHMPIMDGLEFLKKSGAARKIPVVLVSSVGREHGQLMGPLQEQGVSDYVEKPTLTNMKIMGDELIQKLKMAWITKKTFPGVQSIPVKSSFKQRPCGHIAFNFAGSDKNNLIHVLSQQKWTGDELSFFFHGTVTDLSSIQLLIGQHVKAAAKLNFLATSQSKNTSEISVCLHFRGGEIGVLKQCQKGHAFTVIEESSVLDQDVSSHANDISPVTSFSYLVDKFLTGE